MALNKSISKTLTVTGLRSMMPPGKTRKRLAVSCGIQDCQGTKTSSKLAHTLFELIFAAFE
jgi:hypothetical protein